MKQQARENLITEIEGGITAPKGFSAVGEHIGLKKKKKDLALLKSDVPAIAAGVFTKNIVKGAHIPWCQQVIRNKIRGLVINSGNANACTGKTGLEHAEKMARTFADVIKAKQNEILVASTGVIGVVLPIEKVVNGIKATAMWLTDSREGAKKAAESIMTTDTYAKEIAIQVFISGKAVTIAGMAKGSGMIHPNMATMLSFITTDAFITRDLLDKAMKETCEDSYNMISVDGDTSPNDMAIVIANGMARNDLIAQENEDYQKFRAALDYVNKFLARQIINDGEGVTKVIEASVTGALSKDNAILIAKAVVNSNLVKTAIFGEDANWGRIITAAGYSGGYFNPDKASISFESLGGEITLFNRGEPVNFDEDKALRILKERQIKINIALKDGDEKATAWGCDLSYDYVKINGEYRT